MYLFSIKLKNFNNLFHMNLENFTQIGDVKKVIISDACKPVLSSLYFPIVR